MYKEKKILGFIPARGGSKGIPHKNIVDLYGRPLISYSICAGLNSKYIDSIVVSTDDAEIADIARSYGAEVPFMRPATLSSDTSKTVDAVLHAVQSLRESGRLYDTIILLQPTQPLRTNDDIDSAVEKYMENNCISLVSVSPVDDNPLLIRSIRDDILCPLLNSNSTCRRQDMPMYYHINGCIYINEVSGLSPDTSFNDNPLPFIMDKSHSVDIDEPCDLALAEYYLSQTIRRN